jgi:tRNA nucleotidyltransferase/poly(A) polymerase
MKSLPNEVKKLLREIINKGHKAFVVGGAVRDLILEKEPKDFDIITTAPLNELNSLGKTFDIGKQKDFDIINLKFGEFTFEVAHYNGLLTNNLKQRDFKINSLVIDVIDTVYDLFDCCDHIDDKIIGNDDIKEKYKKDPIRMMRAIRQAVSLGFTIEEPDAITELKSLINDVSVERIRDELFKMASNDGKSFAECVKLMDKTGLLEEVIPCIHPLKFFPERFDFHPESYDENGNSSVFNHVIAALNAYKGNDPLVNFGILFHDVGKQVAFKVTFEGKASFHNHEKDGLQLIKDTLIALKFSNDDINTILYLTENHMKIHKGIKRPGKILKVVNHKDWNRLKELSFCDDSCRGPEVFDEVFFNNEIERVEKVANSWNEINKVEKVVSGNLVMEVLGIGSGPIVGKILAEVTDWIIENNISDEQEIINFIKTFDLYKRIFMSL